MYASVGNSNVCMACASLHPMPADNALTHCVDNNAGGDISHFMLYLKLWGCPKHGAVVGVEPMRGQWDRLKVELEQSLPATSTRARNSSERVFEIEHGHNRTCAILTREPLSDRVSNVEEQSQTL